MFHTEIREAHMQVVELPKEEPSLQIDKKIIGINDSFKAVCTVGKSYPAANITWYINTKKVKSIVCVFLFLVFSNLFFLFLFYVLCVHYIHHLSFS